MRRNTRHNQEPCLAPGYRTNDSALRQEEPHSPSRTAYPGPAKNTRTRRVLSSTQETHSTGRRSRRLDVFFSSETPEWYTPHHVVDRVLEVFESIDLDPCSNSRTHPNVPAHRHYTQKDDGLAQTWTGRVYMNPPYGQEIGAWVRKLHEAYQTRSVCEAIALLPARTDTKWFRVLRQYPKCFVSGRLKFGEAKDSAPFPSVVVYLGNRLDRFVAAFSPLGDVYLSIANGHGRSHEEIGMDTANKEDQMNVLSSGTPQALPLLLTEDELISLLRIPEISRAQDYHNVIENLKRMHDLPCIHICKTPLYPFEAVRQWVQDKVEKERR